MERVQLNEIRIGNWVVGNKAEFMQIYAESFNDIEQGWLVPFPVELTPEILEACGFKKHAEIKTLFFLNEFRVDIKHGNVKLLRQCHAAGESQQHACGYPFISDRISCTSVHQLQNLYFALTGSELPIKSLTPQTEQG